MAAGILCTTGVEGGLFTWLTTYAEGRLPESLVTVSLSVLLVAYVPGRFVAGSLSERFGYVPLAFGLGTLRRLSAAFTFLLASGLAALVGVFCVGLTLSGLYPTLLAYATEHAPEHSAPINAVGLVVSSVGIAGVSTVMGSVADGAGIASAMRLLFVPLVGTSDPGSDALAVGLVVPEGPLSDEPRQHREDRQEDDGADHERRPERHDVQRRHRRRADGPAQRAGPLRDAERRTLRLPGGRRRDERRQRDVHQREPQREQDPDD
jgi:hypothetical protein